MNYIPPDRQGEVNRRYIPQKTEEDLPTTNSQQCSAEPSAAQFSNNSSSEPISPLRSNNSAFESNIHNSSVESTLHSNPDLIISKLLFLELELRKLLTALYLEVDVVGRWKIAASYYQKIILPINYSSVKPSLTPSHLL